MDLVEREAFLKENEAWEDLIRRQREDLHRMSGGMGEYEQHRRQPEDVCLSRIDLLRNAVQTQDECMAKLERAISLQMKFLSEKANGLHKDFPVRSLRRQELLRDRIRCVERGFFGLKSEWMTYLWSIP